MRTIVNANGVLKNSRRVTVESRFAILVLTHDGFTLRTYKSSSADPIEQVAHNTTMTNDMPPSESIPKCHALKFNQLTRLTHQAHGMSGAEGPDPTTARLINQPGVDMSMPSIDRVMMGCAPNVNLTVHGNGTSRCLDAEIAEFILYDAILSLVDIDRVAAYLSRKYDLEWIFSTGPKITAISPSNGPTIGGTQVTIFGSFFDASLVNVRVAIGGVNCSVLKYPIVNERILYNTGIVLLTSAGAGLVDVHMTVFEVQTRATNFWQYDAPVIAELRPSSSPASGGSWISVFGTNFGTEEDHAVALVRAADGEVACDVTAYVSHTLLLCKSPRKVVAECQIQIAVGRQRSSAKDLTITHIPSIYECWPESSECMDCCEHRCTW